MLSDSQNRYTLIEKSLLAIGLAYEKFGTFFGNKVTFRTSCKDLQKVLNAKERPDRVNRIVLQWPPNCNFLIEYKPAPERLREEIESMNPPEEVFYTDGACTGNGKPHCAASWAVVATLNPHLTCSGLVTDLRASNQVAEVMAVLKALEIAKANHFKSVTVVTDSKYAFNSLNGWIELWEANEWRDCKRKKIVNREILQKLSELRKEVQTKCLHVKGHGTDLMNLKADALARKTLEDNLRAVLLISAAPLVDQSADPDIRAIKDAIDKGEPRATDKFILKNNEIYKIDRSKPVHERLRLYVPQSQRLLLLKVSHDDPIYGGHLGTKKTRYKLQSYYWPGMNKDIEEYLATCEVCQQHKQPKGSKPGLLRPIRTTQVFQRVHVDIIGRTKASARGHRYIITAIDAFTRYGFAKSYEQVLAEDAIAFLRDEIVLVHGTPQYLVSDNGSHFTAGKFKEFTDSLRMQHRTVCEYNPQANGMDERFNGSLVKIIRNYIEMDQTDWDKHLKTALFVYNTSINESTKFSPYTLLFGRAPKTPLTITIESEEGEVGDSWASHEEIRQTALSNMELAQETQKRQYDKTHREQEFKLFDLVLTKNHAPQKGNSKKFSCSWSGPFLITKLLQHDGVVEAVEVIDTSKMRVRRVPFHDLKIYNNRETDHSVTDNQILPGEYITQTISDSTGPTLPADSTGAQSARPFTTISSVVPPQPTASEMISSDGELTLGQALHPMITSPVGELTPGGTPITTEIISPDGDLTHRDKYSTAPARISSDGELTLVEHASKMTSPASELTPGDALGLEMTSPVGEVTPGTAPIAAEMISPDGELTPNDPKTKPHEMTSSHGELTLGREQQTVDTTGLDGTRSTPDTSVSRNSCPGDRPICSAPSETIEANLLQQNFDSPSNFPVVSQVEVRTTPGTPELTNRTSARVFTSTPLSTASHLPTTLTTGEAEHQGPSEPNNQRGRPQRTAGPPKRYNEYLFN